MPGSTTFAMADESHQAAMAGNKEPIAGDAVEQSPLASESRADDELQPGEFSVENIERIYG